MKNSTIVAVLLGVVISFAIISNIDEDELKETLMSSGLTGVGIQEDEYQEEFEYFIAKYRKSYTSNALYNSKYDIFKQNYKFIKEHNAKVTGDGPILAVNKLADLTNEEYQRKYLGISSPKRHVTRKSEVSSTFDEESLKNPFKLSKTHQAMKDLKIPKSIDWRNKGAIVSVKSMGDDCAASYAFSAVGTIEAIYKINAKHRNALSEQQVIDCSDSSPYSNDGCTSGTVTAVYDYVHDVDMCLETTYEYTGSHDSCKAWYKCKTDNYIAGYTTVEAQSRYNLYEALSTQPVSVAVDASSDTFRFYSSGIMGTDCEESTNYYMIAIGYGTKGFLWFFNNDYIILRNQMGTDWGINGYMHLSANSETGAGMCGVYTDMVYPTL